MNKEFDGKIKRTTMIDEIGKLNSKAGTFWLAGRIIGVIHGGESVFSQTKGWQVLDAGFYLVDESDSILIRHDEKEEINVGDFVQVECEKVGEGVFLRNLETLKHCSDFEISYADDANYKKMVIDGSLKSNLINRSLITRAVRDFFVGQGFLEVETPILVGLPGMEPYLDVFKTRLEADFSADQKISRDMYLITSPEYAMKKLLVGGLEKIFQITKSFRNKETFSKTHNPEFTILEWYRAYADYKDVMVDTEKLIKFLWEKFSQERVGGKNLIWEEKEVDIMGEWERLKVVDAFEKYSGINDSQFFDIDFLRDHVLEKGYSQKKNLNFDDLFYLIFLNEIEPKLGIGKPTILYEYPASMAALSKKCEDERFAERFELYVAGLEICNAFSELNDAEEQQSRLEMERAEREKLGKELYDVDHSFIEALKLGMPPSSGNALGVDRLCMLLLGENDISRVLAFPYKDL